MSAGYIQLAAIGQQDAYLTGDPQVTYFTGVYRRHTPFVLEAYDIPFLGQQVLYGVNNICRIPPKGDLVRSLTLKMTLPALQATGQDFYWGVPPSVSNAATIIFNGNYNYPNIAPYVGVQYYSTFNLPNWFNTYFNNKITYDVANSKFIFQNVSNVYVRPFNGTTNYGVFWGLDPRNASRTSNGYLIYDVSGSRGSDFTLEQAGWLRNPLGGMPDPPTASGMYLALNQNLQISGRQFINFNDASLSAKYWTNFDFIDKFSITQGGRISFKDPGIYMARVGFKLGSGSAFDIGLGQSSTEDGVPPFPVFSTGYTWRVSPDPATPAILPFIITDPNSTVYMYVSATGSTLASNSYVAISPASDVFLLSKDVTVQNNIIPFTSNLIPSGSGFTSQITDGSFNFNVNTLGVHMIHGVLYMKSGYVSKVQLLQNKSNLIYEYDMSSQGRDPTFTFSMPLIVSNIQSTWQMNVYYTGESTILSNSYFIFNQVGVFPPTRPGVELPKQGLMFQSNTSTLTTPFRFNSTDFTSNGVPYVVTTSPSTSNLVFSNVGTYMVSAVLSTADQITSISFGSTTYQVGLGLKPPYTFHVPLRVTNLSNTYGVTITTNGTTSSPNLFSGSFISVYPIATNVTSAITYSYYDSVATWAIDSAELKIGGQSIQTLSGEYIELWNDLNIPYENQQGLKLLTGKGDTSRITKARTYLVNLPFYFNNNPELSIPIVALDRQDLEVHITLKQYTDLTSTPTGDQSLDMTIITEYVYLSDPEIDWFKTNRFDYIITQCQYQKFTLEPRFNRGIFELNFTNPVKELFFVIQPTGNLPYDYSGNGLQSLGLSFNGQDAFSDTTTDVIYVGTIEPFNHHVNFPTRQFYMYSFASNPGSPKPSGAVNFSRINQILLQVKTSATFFERQLRICALSYNVLRIENGLAGLRFNI